MPMDDHKRGKLKRLSIFRYLGKVYSHTVTVTVTEIA